MNDRGSAAPLVGLSDPERTSGQADKLTLGAAVLRGDPRAWGQLCDRYRARGLRYAECHAAFQRLFREAGRPEPTIHDFEEKMMEADELESRA